MYEALRRAGDRILGSFPTLVPLVLHSSISYLGFFINDSPADVIREFAMAFATEASVLAGRGPQLWADTLNPLGPSRATSKDLKDQLL